MPTHFQLTDAVVNTTNTSNNFEMLDRWIPDEDWVRSFRNKPGFGKVTPGELNRAIFKTVDFVNDKFVDPTSGRTMFNNSRKVVTNATEKTKKKIYFYYVLSKDRKESPEFSKKQDFWQAIWDDEERSSRTLKRSLHQKKIEPPNKKQRAMFSIEPKNGATPPQTFQAALSMLLTAWKKTYGDILKFPTKLIAFFPFNKPSVAGKHSDFEKNFSESHQPTSLSKYGTLHCQVARSSRQYPSATSCIPVTPGV
jgi:hypothetical protein